MISSMERQSKSAISGAVIQKGEIINSTTLMLSPKNRCDENRITKKVNNIEHSRNMHSKGQYPNQIHSQKYAVNMIQNRQHTESIDSCSDKKLSSQFDNFHQMEAFDDIVWDSCPQTFNKVQNENCLKDFKCSLPFEDRTGIFPRRSSFVNDEGVDCFSICLSSTGTDKSSIERIRSKKEVSTSDGRLRIPMKLPDSLLMSKMSPVRVNRQRVKQETTRDSVSHSKPRNIAPMDSTGNAFDSCGSLSSPRARNVVNKQGGGLTLVSPSQAKFLQTLLSGSSPSPLQFQTKTSAYNDSTNYGYDQYEEQTLDESMTKPRGVYRRRHSINTSLTETNLSNPPSTLNHQNRRQSVTMTPKTTSQYRVNTGNSKQEPTSQNGSKDVPQKLRRQCRRHSMNDTVTKISKCHSLETIDTPSDCFNVIKNRKGMMMEKRITNSKIANKKATQKMEII